MTEVSLPAEKRFIPRDLSWLAFNERVLEESEDPQNPFLERLKFLAIFVSNLDEFQMVRMAGLKRLIDSGYNRRDRYGMYPHELAEALAKKSNDLLDRLYRIYIKHSLKEMKKNKILLKPYGDLEKDQVKFVRRYFETHIYPITTPLAIDQGRPFPVLPSKTLSVAVSLEQKGETLLAVIPIPKNIPRLLKLPEDGGNNAFILIEDIIRGHISDFFNGYTIKDLALFRVIKDSELSVEEEYAPDLLKAIEDEVKKRPLAKVVYLEVEKAMSSELMTILCEGLHFPQDQVRRVPGTMDLTYLFEFSATLQRPDLSFPSFVPAKTDYENIFEKMNEGDFVIHVPFQSFYPTVDLIQSAAKDPEVLAIKMTLYRTNSDSGIIDGLKDAAQRGKQVTVLVEIKARFDEQNNINWARELELAGCHVIYGIAGLKVHSKMTLIVRKEEGRIRRYVHLSTGNYNESTAKVYTDIGYFTSNDDFARDVSDMFNVITGYSVPSPWKRIISSPNDLRKYFFGLIDKEIQHHGKHQNGKIIAKMNSLEDVKIIDKLYEASQTGVKIQLIVRGICSLIPGVKGLSENIEVKSIVGRFLEHSRIYAFHNNGNTRFFLSSADWMRRNLDTRIELMFEIYKNEIKSDLAEILDLYWQDNSKSRYLGKNRSYTVAPKSSSKINAQDTLIQRYMSNTP